MWCPGSSPDPPRIRDLSPDGVRIDPKWHRTDRPQIDSQALEQLAQDRQSAAFVQNQRRDFDLMGHASSPPELSLECRFRKEPCQSSVRKLGGTLWPTPTLANVNPISAKCWPMSATWARADQLWADIGRIWSTLGRFRPMSAELGWYRPISYKPDQPWTEPSHIRAESGQTWASSSRCPPDWWQLVLDIEASWAEAEPSWRISPTLANFGPMSANFVQIPPDSDQIQPNLGPESVKILQIRATDGDGFGPALAEHPCHRRESS